VHQERELVIAVERGDEDACRKLVEAFLPAIGALALGLYAGVAVERQELVQEGVAGLLFAARRYDAGLDTPVSELSGATGLAPAQLESLRATERTPRGLQEAVGVDAGNTATVGDTIVDPVAEQAYERVLDRLEVREVRDLADRLDARERAVVRAHYGLGQPAQTLTQIGGALGLTAERVRQIEAGALSKLREAPAQPAPAGAGPT
jgi:RNA polymerase sigma factor (sigma-70 family)